VVGKQERVVEEVVVGKTGKDRTETVRDKVRRTDVEVERSGAEEASHERNR
jgi:stress response protein YsnF